MRQKSTLAFSLLLFCSGCGTAYNSGNSGSPSPALVGAAYTMSNATSGNAVFVFMRNPDGTLKQTASYSTGGLGVGHGLENQGGLTISSDQRFLLVVNAGSNDVTAFQIADQGLKQTARVLSGARFPSVSQKELEWYTF